ncbi:mycofactocin biosynthesis chaperone MftB2 [Natrialbaceae archaeon GCM10025810]|uniref:mycofactocin biosynthesis chaperone MftB2 n=1 Tax=Halovalidus salilacus TaxID=3075124 RepID=UPI00360AAAB7
MTALVRKPAHVKYRREADYGFVYEHENYGYEDASLYEVNEVVVDALEFVGDGRSRAEVEREYDAELVDTLVERELLIHEE